VFVRAHRWTVAGLLICGAARAQAPSPDAPTPPSTPPLLTPEAAAESPDEVRASELYEQAVAADARGKRFAARELAQKALDTSPNGRYAWAVIRLLNRLSAGLLTAEPASGPVLPDPTASRVAYVVSGALLGLADGLVFSGTVSGIDGTGVGASGLVGAGIGFGLSLVSAFAVNDGSVPAHLWVGALYGVGAAATLLLLEQGGLAGTGVAAQFGIAMTLGEVAGVLVAANTRLTPADALAGFTCGLHLPLVAVLAEFAALTSSSPSSGISNSAMSLVGASALILGTAGLVGAEVLNQKVRWSGARWGLISLSGVLGSGLGALIAALATLSGPAVLGIIALFDAIGLGIGTLATASMSENTALLPRPGGLAFSF
jgi:hypothetical protein